MINNSPRLLLGLALAVAACREGPPTPPGFQGTVEFDERVAAFEVTGRIQAVNVRRGDVVKDGDVLAQVDETVARLTREARNDDANAARADLALLEAGAKRQDLASLSADVRAARASEELLQKEAARTKALRDTGSLSQSQADRADSDLERATSQRKSLEERFGSMQSGARPQELSRARARLESAVTALALEDERLTRHTLRAKGAGTVLDVHVEPGELAAVGTPAVTMADVSHPYVDVYVAQGELDGVRVGAKIAARVDATAEPFPGKIEFVSPRTEFTPRFLFSERERPHLVVRVRVRLDDPGQKLHSGVPAFVRIDK